MIAKLQRLLALTEQEDTQATLHEIAALLYLQAHHQQYNHEIANNPGKVTITNHELPRYYLEQAEAHFSIARSITDQGASK